MRDVFTRRAGPEDVSRLISAGKSFLRLSRVPAPADGPHLAAWARRFIEEDDRLALVLMVGDQPAGVLMAQMFTPPFAHARVADLVVYDVDPGHRKHSKQLLQEFQRWGDEMGAGSVRAHITDASSGQWLVAQGFAPLLATYYAS